jgi:hydroxyacylglutathione hydrolase
MRYKNRFLSRLCGAAFGLLVLVAAVAAGRHADMPDLTGDEVAAAEVLAASRAGAVIIDVRKPDQYVSRHIPGALSVTLEDLQRGLPPGIESFRDLPVIVYCNTGKQRSVEAKSLLELAGFRNVVNLVGGIRAWIDAGYPVAYGS